MESEVDDSAVPGVPVTSRMGTTEQWVQGVYCRFPEVDPVPGRADCERDLESPLTVSEFGHVGYRVAHLMFVGGRGGGGGGPNLDRTGGRFRQVSWCDDEV